FCLALDNMDLISILRTAHLMLSLLTFLAILSLMELFKWILQNWILSRNGEYLAQIRMFKAFLDLLTTTDVSFMILLALLTLLLQKNTNFKWTDSANETFNTLINHFTSPTIL
ncbi:hypothetical protein HK096_009634, partial [Nowakowskiella sp. JEL0078]